MLVIFASISWAQLPVNVDAFIKINYPSAKYPDHEMFTTYWKYFAADGAQNDPYFGIADYNGDGYDDYAVLLIIDSTLHLVVLNKTKSEFEQFELYDPIKMNSPSDINCGIFVEPPGEFKETEAGKTREIESIGNEYFGIHLKFFESSSIYFYWEDNEFKSLWTSD